MLIHTLYIQWRRIKYNSWIFWISIGNLNPPKAPMEKFCDGPIFLLLHMLLLLLVNNSIERSSVCSRNYSSQDRYDIPSSLILCNLNLQSVPQIFTRCKLSKCSAMRQAKTPRIHLRLILGVFACWRRQELDVDGWINDNWNPPYWHHEKLPFTLSTSSAGKADYRASESQNVLFCCGVGAWQRFWKQLSWEKMHIGIASSSRNSYLHSALVGKVSLWKSGALTCSMLVPLPSASGVMYTIRSSFDFVLYFLFETVSVFIAWHCIWV